MDLLIAICLTTATACLVILTVLAADRVLRSSASGSSPLSGRRSTVPAEPGRWISKTTTTTTERPAREDRDVSPAEMP